MMAIHNTISHQRLHELYPELDISPECAMGWNEIISDLLMAFREYNSLSSQKVKPVQIKEKFGTLRVYTNISSILIDQLVELAEKRSFESCENCGDEGKSVINSPINGWYRTLCSICHTKISNKKEGG